jgi:hypothetical protein
MASSGSLRVPILKPRITQSQTIPETSDLTSKLAHL